MLVVGRTSCGDEPLRRSLRRGLAVAEFVETVNDADRLLPRCHFDCIVVEVDSAADPVLAWVEGLQVAGTVPCICVAEVEVIYHGRSAHASAMPHRGINALDGLLNERFHDNGSPASTWWSYNAWAAGSAMEALAELTLRL